MNIKYKKWYAIQFNLNFVNGYGFLSFAKGMSKNIGKNISKNVSSKYGENRLDHAKKSPTVALYTTSKWVIEKTAEATGGFIGNKVATRITKFHKIQTKIIQKPLQISTMKKYLKKDIYLQKKGSKLLMIWDGYDSIIMEYQKKLLDNTPNQPS